MTEKIGKGYLIETLGLTPLPQEGGYYLETYRSNLSIISSALPQVYGSNRNCSTAIYYLLTPDTFSALHRLPGDEVYHFYLGDPVEMLLLKQDGSSQVVTLGASIDKGMKCQFLVPGGVWQGSRLHIGGEYALLGTTMAPGFEFEDRELGLRDSLQEAYANEAGLIEMLTG